MSHPSYAIVSELKFVSIYDSDHNLIQTIGKKCPWIDEVLRDLVVRHDIQDSLNSFTD